MMEQFWDCSSSSPKGGKKARGDLSRSCLLLCFSFLSKPVRLMSYHHLFLLLSRPSALTLLVCSPSLLRIHFYAVGAGNSLS